ncbi:MAG TPA: hypothetical protein VGE88_19275 [Lysobacter sp.]
MGRGKFACTAEVVTAMPVDPQVFHEALAIHDEIVHVTIEVRSNAAMAR